MINEWLPIETCPEKRDVLLFVPTERNGKTKQVGHWGWTMNKASKLWIIGGHLGFDVGKATHWMDLPEDPK